MGTHLRLYGSDKTALGLLPDHTGLTTQVALNGPGTLVSDYPLLGTNADLLDQNLAYIAVVEDGVESPDWFMLDEDTDDEASEAAEARPLRISARGLMALLEHAEVYPKAHNPGGPVNGLTPSHDFTQATPGTIAKTLIDRAKARGCFPDLTYTFTATHDSAGVAWPKAYDVTYAAGTNYLSLVTAMADNAWADLRMSGFELEMFVPETVLGEDRTGSVLLRLGQQVLEAPRKKSRRGIISHLLGIGADKNMVEVSNAATATKYGRREGNASDGRMTTNGSLTNLATESLNQHLEAKEGFTLKLSVDAPPGEDWPVPGIDYGVGHKIAYDKRRNADGSYEALRVRTITRTYESATEPPSVSLELNDLFVEAAIRLQRRVTGIVNGSVVDAPPPVDTSEATVDTTIPKAPGVPSVESFAYPVGSGFRAGVNVTWTPTTRNTDESDYADHQLYLVQFRFSATDAWSAAPPVADAFWSIDGLETGREFQVQVAAQDSSGHVSTWSASPLLTLEADLVPTAAPSQMTASTRLGTVTLVWDGLDLDGAPLADDFAYAEVYRSANPAIVAPAGELIDRFNGRGGTTVASGLPYDVEQFFTMVAYDTSGNVSEASAAASAIPTRLVSVDVTAGAIDDLALADDAVTMDKLAQQARDLIESAPHVYMDNGEPETPPGGFVDGDLRIDAADGNKTYRYNGAFGPLPRTNLATNPAMRSTAGTAVVRTNRIKNPLLRAVKPAPTLIRTNLSLVSRATTAVGWSPNNATNYQGTNNVPISGHPDGIATASKHEPLIAGGANIASLYNPDGLGPSTTSRGLGVWVYSTKAANVTAYLSDEAAGTRTVVAIPAATWVFVKSAAPNTGDAVVAVTSTDGNAVPGTDYALLTGSVAEAGFVPGFFYDGDTPDSPDFAYAWTGAAGSSSSTQTATEVTGVSVGGNAFTVQSTEWTRPDRAHSVRLVSNYVGPGSGYVDVATLAGGDLEPGKTYTLSGWFYSDPANPNNSANLSFVVVGAGGNAGASPPDGGGESFVSLTFTVPTDPGMTGCYLRLYNALPKGDADVWMSDLLFEETSEPLPYFDGETRPELRANLLTNPGWRATSGTIEVRRNVCADPRLVNASGWASITATGVAGQASPNFNQAYSPNVAAPVGEVWTVSADLTAPSGAAFSGDFGAKGTTGAIFGSNTQSMTAFNIPAATTQRITATYTVGAGADGLRLLMSNLVNYAGAKIDKVLIEKVGTGLPYFDGATVATQGLTYSWVGGVDASDSIAVGPTFAASPFMEYAAQLGVIGWQSAPELMRMLTKNTVPNGGILAFSNRPTTAAPVAAGQRVAGRFRARLIGGTADVSIRPRLGPYSAGTLAYVGTSILAALPGTNITLPASGAWVDVELPSVDAAPATTATARFLIYANGDTPAGTLIEFSQGLIETVAAAGDLPGPYFDGATTDGTDGVAHGWRGAPEMSRSFTTPYGLTPAWSGAIDASTPTLTGAKVAAWGGSDGTRVQGPPAGNGRAMDVRDSAITYTNASPAAVGEFYSGRAVISAIPGETPPGTQVRFTIHDGLAYVTPGLDMLTLPDDGTPLVVEAIASEPTQGTAPRLYVYPSGSVPVRVWDSVLEKVPAAGVPAGPYIDGAMATVEWDGTADASTSTYTPGWVEVQDAAAALSAANAAMESANGKNKITHSLLAPGSVEGETVGDTWFQHDDNGVVTAQWQWDGTDWLPQTLGSAVIAALDVGKLTGGEIDAQHVRVGAGVNFDNGYNPRIVGTSGGYTYFNVLSAYSGVASLTDSLVIRTPITFTGPMARFKIGGRNLAVPSMVNAEAQLYAYALDGGTIYQPTYSTYGDMKVRIRFAKDAANKLVLIIDPIGATWRYPEISLSEVGISYAAAYAFVDGWTSTWMTEAALTAEFGSTITQATASRDLDSTHGLTQKWVKTGTTTINGGEVAADTVTAVQLVAGAATLEKLTVGSIGDERAVNGGLEEVSSADPLLPAGWKKSGIYFGGTFGWNTAGPIAGTRSLDLIVTTPGVASKSAAIESRDFPVKPGETYALKVTAKDSQGTSPGFYLGLMGSTTGPGGSSGALWAVANATVPLGAGTEYSGTITIPAGWNYARVIVMNYSSTSTVAHATNVDVISCRPVIVSVQIGDGQVKAPNIEADAIKAVHIDATAITADMVNAGVLSAEITVSGRIATALTGARVQINSSGIQAYNAAGTLMVNVPSNGSGSTFTGTFQTGLTGARAKLWAASGQSSFELYTGMVSETAPGRVVTTVAGTGSAADATLWLMAPQKNSLPSAEIQLKSRDADTGADMITSVYNGSHYWRSDDGYGAHYFFNTTDSTVTDPWLKIRRANTGSGPGAGVYFENGPNYIKMGGASAGGTIDIAAQQIRLYSTSTSYAVKVIGDFDHSSGTVLMTDEYGQYRIRGYTDATSPLITSDVVYNRTYTNAPNMYITSFGTIGRSTSSERYKINIDRNWGTDAELGAVKSLRATSYYDKGNTERYAEWAALPDGVRSPNADADFPRRLLGLIAEDVQALGLTDLVSYGDDGLPNGVSYERLAVALLPWLHDLESRLAAVEGETVAAGA